MTLKIVSLDPGGTTGYTVGVLEDKTLRVTITQCKFNHEDLYRRLEFDAPDYIICESFEYRNRARPGLVLISCELIGVVKLYNQTESCILEMQNAAKGKGYFIDDKLKSMNLYIQGRRHGMDSFRHLMQWWTFGPGFKYNEAQEVIICNDK